jgi:hypothetical protein
VEAELNSGSRDIAAQYHPSMAYSGVHSCWVRVCALASLVLVLSLTTGCTGRSLFGSAPPAEDIEFAKSYLALFSSRSFPAMEMGMDPSLKDPQIRAKLLQMASLFPPGEPSSVRLIGSNFSRSGNTTTSSLSLQYEYPGRWILADVVVERQGQAPVVKGVHVQPLRDALDRINRFTFAGKGPMHYAALSVAGLILLFVLYTFLLAIRTPAPSMKWAWALFVLVGIVRFAFNWTTGALSIVPMSVLLFGSGFTKSSPFDALIITTSIPVGAIVYLIQRREWLQEPDPPSDVP